MQAKQPEAGDERRQDGALRRQAPHQQGDGGADRLVQAAAAWDGVDRVLMMVEDGDGHAVHQGIEATEATALGGVDHDQGADGVQVHQIGVDQRQLVAVEAQELGLLAAHMPFQGANRAREEHGGERHAGDGVEVGLLVADDQAQGRASRRGGGVAVGVAGLGQLHLHGRRAPHGSRRRPSTSASTKPSTKATSRSMSLSTSERSIISMGECM